jgi:hypothetical protein
MGLQGLKGRSTTAERHHPEARMPAQVIAIFIGSD